MADIFLSYARADLTAAGAVADDLLSEGYSVFFDQQIGVGESWDALIETEIDAAKCVVVLWSPVSRDREWVRNEARYGKQRGALCPATIARCVIPLEFNGMQTADLCGREAWDRTHPEWRRLMSAIARLAGTPAEAAREKQAAMPAETGNVAYWKAFQPVAESHGRSRKALKEVVRSENYTTPLDRPAGFEVYASAYLIRSKMRRYGAYLWLWAYASETREQVLPVLQALKPELDAALGEPVAIERASKQGIWISVTRSGDPDDRSAWPAQHAWLAERMSRLASAYHDLIAAKLPRPA
jgi:hypothetical protein